MTAQQLHTEHQAAFDHHRARCDRCRRNSFDLCAEGKRLCHKITTRVGRWKLKPGHEWFGALEIEITEREGLYYVESRKMSRRTVTGAVMVHILTGAERIDG